MTTKQRNPWFWIPSLYYAQGIPFVIVMMVSVILYKRLGISNTDIALYTSWLYLPWVIKPIWSPIVDIVKTHRRHRQDPAVLDCRDAAAHRRGACRRRTYHPNGQFLPLHARRFLVDCV